MAVVVDDGGGGPDILSYPILRSLSAWLLRCKTVFLDRIVWTIVSVGGRSVGQSFSESFSESVSQSLSRSVKSLSQSV